MTVGLEPIAQRSPFVGYVRLDGRHRHLGKTTGDERSEDHTERLLLEIADRAGEYEAETAPRALHPSREAGIGRFKAEAVPVLERARLLTEATSQGEEVLGVAVGGDASSEASHGVRGQGRRDEEPVRFEVEDRIRGPGCRFGFHVLVRVKARRTPATFITCHSSNRDDGSSTCRR